MTQQIIRLQNGEEITYWTHHDNKSPTLVLVHGFTGSHEGFQYLVPLLSDFRLVIPDLPGFGLSPLPHHKLSLADLGKLLADFVQQIELEQPCLVGHSMGSLVVAEAIKQQPKLFAKKIILASPVPSPVGIADSRRIGVLAGRLYYTTSHRLPYIGPKLATSKKITRISTGLIMTAKDRKMQKAIHEHHFNNLNHISDIGWYKKLHKEINRTGISHYIDALKRFDILIVNGDSDVVTPLEHQQGIATDLDALIVTLQGTGHLAHYEKPKELATAISGFLK